ncbi:AraC family transcriptional regulator [Billgrantia gudaonensis]|uniref:AraC family transcriptional regulator n=1 Tax=Billgrantia gudaonensis TaxID=376427 RepID=A0A432JH51_9GAMM|nr:AraC family transcriptional regulator [Halomonas gudaonensis]
MTTSTKPNLEKLASIAELSEFHFQKMFLKSFAISPSRWVFHRRIRKAEDLLTGHYPISDIAVRCGFSDQSHLTDPSARQPERPRCLPKADPKIFTERSDS